METQNSPAHKKTKKKWRENNKERQNQMSKDWYKKNREHAIKNIRRWQEEHPKQYWIAQLNRAKRKLKELEDTNLRQ